MNLLNFRDRIRAKAIEVGLSYSEIEGLTDVNELLNQEMPCLMFNYEQETNDFSTPSTVLTPRIYLITTIFDAELTETGEYQRDWIITKKNELREKYIDWIKIMQLDGSSYIEVLNDTQLQLQQRVSVEGFLIMEALPQFKVSREFCLLTEEGGVTPPSGGCNFNLVFECNGVEIQTAEDLDPCIENNITLTGCCEPLPATVFINGVEVGEIFNGNTLQLEVVNQDNNQVGELSGGKWVVTEPRTLTLNISVSETDDFVQFTATSSMVGSITSVNFGSLTNGTIQVNAGVVTTPFNIALNDVIRLEFDTAVSDDTIVMEGTYV